MSVCSSSPKECGSHVQDHGAKDEYVEVEMKLLLESSSDLTVNCSYQALHFCSLLFLPNFGRFLFVATFRVARLTLQTRKLWCDDRP